MLAAGSLSLSSAATSAGQAQDGGAATTLDETRLTLNKWIETQQIISKERNDWQQGKEILLGRLELVRKEVTALEQKIEAAGTSLAEAERKRAELQIENDALGATGARLTEAVTAMEARVKQLHAAMPQPVRERIDPLYQRIPEDPAATRVSAAERFQNVLGILNELNKANNEITVSYDVRTLADGKPGEVRAVYAGLAQAWYVSAGGEAGIGRPVAEGWQWEPSNAIAPQVLETLDILQGKGSPEFVGLPVKIQ